MNTSEHAVYNDTVVRQFSIMAVVWGVVGMLVGVIIASQVGLLPAWLAGLGMALSSLWVVLNSLRLTKGF